jgi:hypothetical protein
MESLAQSINFLGIEVAEEEENHFVRPLNFLDDSATISGSKSPSQTYIYKGTTSSHQRVVKPKKKPKSEKLEIKHRSKDKIVKLLYEVGEERIAERMTECGQKYDVFTCGEHIASKNSRHCNVRFCPLCASRRSAKYRKKYLAHAQEFVKRSPIALTPCLLTLTQEKITGERLKDSRERMLSSFRNFIRHSFFSEYFAGGLFTVENAVSDKGNHLHLHVVVFRKKFIDHKLLKVQWAMVSPGAKNLNIKLIDDLESGLREVIKYVSKPIDVDRFKRSHLSELLEIRGSRMIDTFGDFRKFCSTNKSQNFAEKEEREAISEGQCCPRCNEGLFRLTMSPEQLIAFYRRVEQLERGSPVAVKVPKIGLNSSDRHTLAETVSRVFRAVLKSF